MSRQTRFLTAGLVGTLLLATTSCGSDSKSVSAGSIAATTSTAAATTTVAASAVATTPAPAPTEAGAVPTATTVAATDPPAQAGGKVNINEASIPELEAAFKAEGVSNARRWAQEVDEYRPYATDPSFAKLRQELGKYNIDPKVLELIISILEF